jgi:SAM-dependent methyltransferase
MRARANDAFQPGPVLDRTLGALPPFAELARTRPTALLALLRYATYLNVVVPRSQGARRTLEIGSGAGLVSLGLRRLLGAQCVLLDLPEMLAVAFPVLANYEGEDAVTLPHEVGDTLPETPYVLLTPSQASLVADGSIDLALNTASFQEMTYEAIGGYFQLLRRALAPGGLFYCVNDERCEKVEGAPIEFDRYPWPDEWEILLDRPFDYSVRVMRYRDRERLTRAPA